MKREAGSGLKLGTRTKLEQNRAECRRERKGVSSCVFPVPPTHSEEKWSTTFLWKRIFLLKMASKGLSLKPLCALGSLSHTGRLHCVSVIHSHGFPPPPVGSRIPTLDLDIRPFCQAPNLDIQHLFLGSSIQMAHRKFQNWSHLPYKPSPPHVSPTWTRGPTRIRGWSHPQVLLILYLPPSWAPSLISEEVCVLPEKQLCNFSLFITWVSSVVITANKSTDGLGEFLELSYLEPNSLAFLSTFLEGERMVELPPDAGGFTFP